MLNPRCHIEPAEMFSKGEVCRNALEDHSKSVPNYTPYPKIFLP